MDRQLLRRDPLLMLRFRQLRPWYTRVVVKGVGYGGGADFSADGRPRAFADAFPEARRVLELGCLEGGHTFMLAAEPSVVRVLGVDARADNIARARFARKVLAIDNAEFAVADLEQVDLRSLGEFDGIFCAGLLYHLPRPWELVEQMAQVADRLLLCTQYAPDGGELVERGGYRGGSYAELGLDDALSGMSTESFWPTRSELLRMLADHGYGNVDVLVDNPASQNGPRITLTAHRKV